MKNYAEYFCLEHQPLKKTRERIETVLRKMKNGSLNVKNLEGDGI
jgi:hypothetical protein